MNMNLEKFGEVSLINFIDLAANENLMILGLRNHPDIKRWMYNSNDISEKDHFNFIDSLKNNLATQYFLVQKGSHTIGVIYFINIDSEKEVSEFGLYANPLDLLKSKGSILQSTVIRYAFDFLNLKSLKLEVLKDNERAIKLYKKYNFQYIGIGCNHGKAVLRMELKANR